MKNRPPTEVWANGPRWRTITLHSPAPFSIQYSWGKFDKDVEYYLRMFHGNLTFAMESTAGSGTEKWWHDLPTDQARARVAIIRKAAERAGFKNIGTY